MKIVDVERLRRIAEVEFSDIVLDAYAPDINELRIILLDDSFVDVWFSLKLLDRYSYHWERSAIDGSIYRHDNAPHNRWQVVSTFPNHFHDGSEANVVESHLDQNPERALREFLTFARNRLG